jgi:raffinose/stachyose/melibiose transport system permease protein
MSVAHGSEVGGRRSEVGTERLLRLPTPDLRLSSRLPVFVILLLIAGTTVYPLVFLAINAFKRKTEYYLNTYGLPHALYLGNFQLLGENFNIARAVLNSLFVTGVAVTVSIFLAALASFPLAKIAFAGQQGIFRFVVALLLIPGQVLLIPVYLLFSRLNLVNNYLSVILIYTAVALPFGIFFLTSSFRAIPSEVIESARIDGATLPRVFSSIILPLGRPAIATLAVLSSLSMWNELLLGLMLLPDESKRLITPTIALLLGRLLTNQPLLMAALLISSLPTIVMLAIASRQLISGITLGFAR